MPAHLYDVHSVCCLLPAFTHTWGCSRNGSICMDRYNFMSFKNASQALCSNGQTDSGNVTNENHVHAVPQPSRLQPRICAWILIRTPTVHAGLDAGCPLALLRNQCGSVWGGTLCLQIRATRLLMYTRNYNVNSESACQLLNPGYAYIDCEQMLPTGLWVHWILRGPRQ